jgi:DNA-binding transcriptional ArsR family regulator
MRNRSVTYRSPQNKPEVVFHALADATRLAVLDLLREQPQSVGEIAALFPISRPAISKHLSQLHKARLVLPTRRGRHRFFRLNAEPLVAVDSWLSQYRSFWGRNLNNLKAFVEEEHARESSCVSVAGSSKSRRKHK